ncbi:hypothetical protein PHLCEN_2v2410 [Hermanssonia centrifuga]|uniref:Uncharacterized protein n=1 Tax=Hermanssonia centrifuga TaxID=98765 RepID=A0A2R6RM30_9APHY|nr:hypothetical protein PHLCEN_2v2410 [Hermanssonia centrifuga]
MPISQPRPRLKIPPDIIPTFLAVQGSRPSSPLGLLSVGSLLLSPGPWRPMTTIYDSQELATQGCNTTAYQNA